MTEVKKLRWAEVDPNISQQWLDLLIADDGSNVSLAAEWIDAIGQARQVTDHMYVVVAYRDGELSGVLPYYYTTRQINGLSVRAVELGGNLASYHQDAIGPDWELLFEACINELWEQWDVAVGVNLLTTRRAAEAFRNCATRKGHTLFEYPGEVSPYLEISTGWDEFFSGYSRKVRGKINRYERRFQEMGEVETRWYQDVEKIDEFMAAMLVVEAASWKIDAEMSIVEGSAEYSYYQRLLVWLAKNGWLVANVEYLDKKPVAYSLCYHVNGKLGQMKTSFDDAYKEHSVGTVAIKHALVYAFDHGVREFDFHGDRMPHKARWAKNEREHGSYFLFAPTLKGRTLSAAKKLLSRLKKDA